MADKFFVIKLVNQRKQIGWIVDNGSGGFLVASGKLPFTVKQFEKFGLAEKFIVKNKLKKNGRAYILSSEDLMNYERQDISKLEPGKKMFFIENDAEQKLFYDTENNSYLFKKGDAGYCLWYDEEEPAKFMSKMKIAGYIKPLENKKKNDGDTK